MCGYWLRARISHFYDQKATFQGGVKCEESGADRISNYCSHSLKEINKISMAVLGLVYLINYEGLFRKYLRGPTLQRIVYEILKSFDFIKITLISGDFTDFIEITLISSDFTDFKYL